MVLIALMEATSNIFSLMEQIQDSLALLFEVYKLIRMAFYM